MKKCDLNYQRAHKIGFLLGSAFLCDITGDFFFFFWLAVTHTHTADWTADKNEKKKMCCCSRCIFQRTFDVCLKFSLFFYFFLFFSFFILFEIMSYDSVVPTAQYRKFVENWAQLATQNNWMNKRMNERVREYVCANAENESIAVFVSMKSGRHTNILLVLREFVFSLRWILFFHSFDAMNWMK